MKGQACNFLEDISNHAYVNFMIIQAATLSANEILRPRFRSVMWKSLGLTVLLFFGIWLGLQMLATSYLFPYIEGWTWITTLVAWFLGVGVILGAGFLLAPTSALFAGLFLDEVAEHIEENHYPQHKKGKALPLGDSITLALKFVFLVIGVNLAALFLFLVFGLGVIVFFVANGYLLGREYFQFAAMRYTSEKKAHELRRQHWGTVFMGGMLIAGLMAIPFLNIFTPVFAAGMMVHLHKSLASDETMALHFGR